MSQATTAEPAESELPPLVEPGATKGLVDVFRQRYVLRLLVKRELAARYQGSVLGMLWSYIQPAVRFAMYFFVIGIILNLRNVEWFGIHMFAGMVVVHFFTETFTAGTRSVVRNKAIVSKLPMPREMFPVASMLVSAYHTLPQMLILVIACTAVGWQPDAAGFGAGLLALLIVSVLGTALALFFAAANVFFRDFGNVVQTLTVFVTFSVPMIYPYSRVEDRFGEAAQYYLLNPLAEVVLLMQRCFWTTVTEDPDRTAATELPSDLFARGFVMLGISVVLLVVAQVVFTRLENKFPERL